MPQASEQVFYKLSELSETLGVENSVLRYWEKEFSQIKPMKIGPRKRLYRRRDLEIFREIKRLLYEERYTIAGAKKRLDSSDSRQGRLFEDDDKIVSAPLPLFEDGETSDEKLRQARALLSRTRRELLEIRKLLAAGREAAVSPDPSPGKRGPSMKKNRKKIEKPKPGRNLLAGESQENHEDDR
jgi:DNA-binding transcriptional MerR regulator